VSAVVAVAVVLLTPAAGGLLIYAAMRVGIEAGRLAESARRKADRADQ
jgi:hypothetical protein